MDRMCEFVDDDIITKLYRESHELNIQANRISVTTAPPSGFLMAAGHSRVTKAELPRELHRSMWEKRFREFTKLEKFCLCERGKS